MSKVDISSAAVEDRAQCADAWGVVNLAQGRVGQSDDMATLANTLRAQAERIADLERCLKAEIKSAEKDDSVWHDNYATLERKLTTARNEALREALELTENDYSASCPSCSTVHSKLTALIEGATND